MYARTLILYCIGVGLFLFARSIVFVNARTDAEQLSSFRSLLLKGTTPDIEILYTIQYYLGLFDFIEFFWLNPT